MELQLFNSPQFGEIRTAGTPDNPQFCLSDVCRILGVSVKGVNQRLDKEVISNYPLQTAGGTQQMCFVNEDGLYDVILDSRKPEAKAFRKWITSEVLPSIRKNGGYIAARKEDTPEEIMAKAVLLANKTIELQKQKLQMLEGQNKLLEQENQELVPKAQYTDEVLQATDTMTFTELAKEMNMRSVHVLIKRMTDDRIVYRKRNNDGSYIYLPYANYSALGYFTTRTNRYYHKDGTPGASPLTVITQKGRLFLHQKYNVALQPIDLTMFKI